MFQKPLSDPISYDMDIVDGLVLDLHPLDDDRFISKRAFIRICGTISILFDHYGPVWLDSNIERGGQVIGNFSLSF